MFTGIVERSATVVAVEGAPIGRSLTLDAPGVTEGLAVGSSVAVNGACLTAVAVEGSRFRVDVVVETLRRTNLGDLAAGSRVNVERAMPASGRFDGHVVQGHVDGVGTIESIAPEGEGVRMTVRLPDGLDRYVVEKGSITVDGVSLTVADVSGDRFEVALIPHTLELTTLGDRAPGDRVNLEADVLAKYVERLLEIRR